MYVKSQLRRTPTLVLDVHDWYAETYLAPGAVVRPGQPARVLAEPTASPPPRGWPFNGAAELVTLRSPAGFVVFFDSARALARPTPSPDPLATVDADPWPAAEGPVRRLTPPPGTYRLSVRCTGFQDSAQDVALPAAGPPNIKLLPGPTYPFPTGRRPNGYPGPTLLRGGVLTTDGLGVAGVVVDAPAWPLVQPCTTDAAGQWVLVLDPYNPIYPQAPPQPGDDLTAQLPALMVDLRFTFPDGQTLPVNAFPVTGGMATSFPLTSLRGEVRDTAGRPVAGATVSVDSFPSAARSRTDGNWAYVLALDAPRAGSTPVTIRALAPSGAAATTAVTLNYGTLTRVEPIIL